MLNQYRKDASSFLNFASEITEAISNDDVNVLNCIIDELAPYDIYDIIAKVSSLNLLIENQNKSILLDAFIAAIMSRPRESYKGKAIMSSGKFRNLITRLETMGLKMMVDPAENAFIERVRYYGNYWIFPGINYSPSYCLQSFLDVLCLRNLKMDAHFMRKVAQLVTLTLEISDGIVHSLGYDLEMLRHVEEGNIRLPDSILSTRLKHCVVLPYSYFEKKIEDQDLLNNLFCDFECRGSKRVISGNWQDFFAHPFLKVDATEVIVLNPSILIPFVVHQLILLADSYGIKQSVIDAYNNEIWRACKTDLRDLGHKKIFESYYGITLENSPCHKEEIMTVSNDKLLFVHFVCDSGNDYNTGSMFETYDLSGDLPAMQDRNMMFQEKLKIADENSIFQIVLINSFGRTVGCERSGREAQYTIVLSPYELHCIAVNERSKEEFIARYITAKKKLNMMIPPTMISELNSIELYTSRDYSFYFSDDYNLGVMSTFFAPGDSLDYVIRAIKNEDRHLLSSYDGIHLCDVVLNDPVRNIYFTKGGGNKPPELVVKFGEVNIWFTFGNFTTKEESDVLYSIIDTISYWLSESKEIINRMTFRTDAIRIHIELASPGADYYELIEEKGDFFDGIQYTHSGNMLIMLWHPSAYQKLGERTNNTEKALLISLLEELAKLNHTEANLCMVEDMFSNPLRKKVFEINAADTPYMIPTSSKLPIISAEEENRLLDEIGEHFLALPEYDYGKVPDDKRANLANKVVGYLYSLLQSELACIRTTGLFEKIYTDLETVMQHIMVTHRRYAYDVACYPEKTEYVLNKYNETNKVSAALKFFAEYVAAVPPTGEKILGKIQYDRILAICSLIIDWAYKNDLFVYNIFSSAVEFLQSGRIGMSRTQADYLDQINATARIRKIESLSDPRIPVYSPTKPYEDFIDHINDAFSDEYGFTYQQFAGCILGIADYGDKIKTEVKRADRELVINSVAEETHILPNTVSSIIELISLCQRENFLDPPKPFKKYDVYPWRFNRELSFTRRPIIQYNDELIWGNRQLHHMLRYTVDLIMEGKYKARKSK